MVQGLGERLHKQRLRLKISQKEVADSIGVSPSVISNYESSLRVPSIKTLISLAKFYQCSADYLLGLDDTVINKPIPRLNDKQQLLLQQLLNSLS